MAAAREVSAKGVYVGNDDATTTSFDSTTSDVLIAIVVQQTTNVPTITDNQANTWPTTPIINQADSVTGSFDENLFVFRLEGGTTNAAHTVTTTSTGSFPTIIVVGLSGTSLTYRASSTKSGADSTDPRTLTDTTPNGTSSIFIGVVAGGETGGTTTADWSGGSYTEFANETDGDTYWPISVADVVVTTTTVVFDVDWTSNDGLLAAIEYYEDTGGGGLSVPVAAYHYRYH